MTRALLALCCWLVLLAPSARAAEPVPLPALNSRVTDLTGTLDATQRGRLEARLAAIDRAGQAQVAVLLLPTTQPETIEQFGIRLAETWKIGRKGADDGLIIIVAKNDRRMRIEVGYGLEGSIPDAIAKRIIDERMASRFKAGDFAGGLEAAVDSINGILSTGAMPPSQEAAPRKAGVKALIVMGAIESTIIVLIVFALFVPRFFGLLGSLLVAAFGAWIGFSLIGSLAGAGIGAALAFALALGLSLIPMDTFLRGLIAYLLMFGGSSGYGGGNSRRSGGFSGGGYSGGGGGFGGGGSSGSW